MYSTVIKRTTKCTTKSKANVVQYIEVRWHMKDNIYTIKNLCDELNQPRQKIRRRL